MAKPYLTNNLGTNILGGLIVALILAVIPWSLKMFFNVDEPLSFIFEILLTSIPIPAIITLLSLIIIGITVYRKIFFQNNRIIATSDDSIDSFGTYDLEEIIRKLSKTEKLILRSFGAADGGGFGTPELSTLISENKIRTQEALDSLRHKDLLLISIRRMSGPEYSLSTNGLSAVVKLGYDLVKFP